MNEKETRLEEISNKVNSYQPTKHLPIFEMYVSVFSILMAVSLFLFPDMLVPTSGGVTSLYSLLQDIMPQACWAFTFFIASMTKSIGMLLDNAPMRVIGLIMSIMIYLVFTILYGILFPSIGAISFGTMTLFTAISISAVKHTSIRQ